MQHRLRFPLALVLLVVGGTVLTAAPPEVDFGRQVRPILSDKCFKCHGPDEGAREGDLRLDLAEPAAAALSRDKPRESELLRRILSSDDDERMPPSSSKLSLTKKEIETLKAWILSRAPYNQHWSFVPVPTGKTPPAQDSPWPRNPIDNFVLARLKAAGLKPAPPASKERLIRRLCFDLTGLPPTLAEIDAFLADDSPNAYEKLVDRLLQKDQYGERMAAKWMDLARYADTYGYQVDRNRHVWPWRDWVVKSYNGNMPFDQFVTWQLAGDLLPKATDEQILATTFNRLHSQKVEGGSTPEEFRVEYVADRNHTFATTFLGLTLECARCHDHKYDPLSQKEYYQLFAFFNNIDEAGLYSYFTSSVPTPTLLLTDKAQKAKIASLEKEISAAEAAAAQTAKGRQSEFAKWLAERPALSDSLAGQVAHHDFEKHKGGANASVPGRVGKAIKLSGDDAYGVGVGNFRRFEPFSVSFWMQTPDHLDRSVVFHRSRAWTDAASRGYELLIINNRLRWSLIHFWPGNAISIQATRPLPKKKWIHVVVSYDGSSRAAGLRMFVDGKQAEYELFRDNLYKNISGGGGDKIAIGERFRDRGFTNGLIDEFRVFNRRLTPIEAQHLYDDQALKQALTTPADQLTAEQTMRLREFYLSTADAAAKAARAKLRTLRERRSKMVDGISEIMVMREMARRRPTHLLKRGAYDAPAEVVQPRPPAVFPKLQKGQPDDRLGLARWLTSRSHPLTSRVAVNRLWQMCMGRGIVVTPEDFGSQGKPPTHPQLLDWLADDFMSHGWDVKRVLKQIVMSATYRQSSQAGKLAMQKDHDNLLFSRSSRFRWPAEMVRDNALAVSGLLSGRMGGAPAKPYELTLSFKPLGRDKGEGNYRRSLYTFWKRTAPAPVMMSLDASKREVCVAKRERTSSPLQALVLMNDTQFVEAARVLAERQYRKHDGKIEACLAEVFRLLTSRRAGSAETKIVTRMYDRQLRYFLRHKSRALEFLKVGDTPRDNKLPAEKIAALGVVINGLMNFDECATRY